MTLAKQSRKPSSEDQSYVLDDQIGFVLRLAFQFHTSIFMSRMVANLTQTQFATLSKIADMGECSQSDLVRLIALDSATINGVVSRMKARGFVAISEDPVDRRRQFLKLTRIGAQVVAQAQAIGQEITAETLALLTPTERVRVIQLLRKMMGSRQGQVEPEAVPSPIMVKRRLGRPAAAKVKPPRPMRGSAKA